MYHESTSSEGNLGSFTKDYYEITFENHKKLFGNSTKTDMLTKSMKIGISP